MEPRTPGTVSLSLKNVPVGLTEKLRLRARRAHRSLQGELLAILEEAVAPPRAWTAEEILARVRSLGLATEEEAATMVRTDRDAR